MENVKTNHAPIPPKWRIYLMKGLYLIVFLGLGKLSWGEIISPSEPLNSMDGIVYSFYAALAVLMGLGLRYPLKILPLIFLQFLYKSLWVLGVYFPMKSAGVVDSTAEGFLKVMVTGIILDVIVIPWFYFYKVYIKNLFSFSTK